MQWKKKFPQEIKNICLCSPFDAIKKPLSSSSLSRLFATALFFIGALVVVGMFGNEVKIPWFQL
jgi:hypothetical protein